MGTVLSIIWDEIIRVFGVGLVAVSQSMRPSVREHHQAEDINQSNEAMSVSEQKSEVSSHEAYMDADLVANEDAEPMDGDGEEVMHKEESVKHDIDSMTHDNEPPTPEREKTDVPPISPSKSNWENRSERPKPQLEGKLPPEKKTKLEEEEPKLVQENRGKIKYEAVPNLHFGEMDENFRPATLSPEIKPAMAVNDYGNEQDSLQSHENEKVLEPDTRMKKNPAGGDDALEDEGEGNEKISDGRADCGDAQHDIILKESPMEQHSDVSPVDDNKTDAQVEFTDMENEVMEPSEERPATKSDLQESTGNAENVDPNTEKSPKIPEMPSDLDHSQEEMSAQSPVITENAENIDPNTLNTENAGKPPKNAEDSLKESVNLPKNQKVLNQVCVQWSGTANEVFITGSWLNWEDKVQLEESEKNVWSANVSFDCEEVEMKFIVDGKWVVSPDMPWRESEPGIRNNYLKFYH